jgi:hypothetical protein
MFLHNDMNLLLHDKECNIFYDIIIIHKTDDIVMWF